jgi:L-threonylcarbamoyladenylate synthase
MENEVESQRAVELLRQGGVGVLPTDTVYGLVARAADEQAVVRLYALKHREHKPGTVIAASVEQLEELGVERRYLDMAKKWWPGPLSIETPLEGHYDYLTQGTGHCAWRVVGDEGLRRFLEQTGPLQTSSANQPGEPVSVSVEMAKAYFGGSVDFYVDGGDLSERKPSTVVRMVGNDIEVIRRGAVDVDSSGVHASAVVPRDCPFCRTNRKLKGDVLFASDGAYLIEAVSNPGDYLIIPELHVESLSELTDTWWHEVKSVLGKVPDLKGRDYNVSVNVGTAAGQTVRHLHFWVIPRGEDRPSSGTGLAGLIEKVDASSELHG